ncbi:hypothetical protein AcV5_002865 [Taiwanofungus camphoratus]|nr:hypothetical protein AcV5_002865 [Antrodia cinnamomea]
MRQRYQRVTEFIWPSKWKHVDDIPKVDGSVRFLLGDLHRQVLQAQREGRLDSSTTNDVPDDILPLLVGSFSAMFQACKHSRTKAHHSGTVSEASWRHDHDRLLFDFFNNAGDDGYSLSVGVNKSESQSASASGKSDDISPRIDTREPFEPPVYPSLERLLWLPKSMFVDKEDAAVKAESGQLPKYFKGLNMDIEALQSWAVTDEQLEAADSIEERDAIFVHSQSATWRVNCYRENLLTRLGEAPTKGVCDALGTLRIVLDIPHKLLGDVRFASLDPPKRSYAESRTEESKKQKQKQSKQSASGQSDRKSVITSSDWQSVVTSSDQKPTVTSSDHLAPSPVGIHNYDILASTKCTSPTTRNLSQEKTDVVSELATSMSDLGVSVQPKGPSESVLELPLIFAEYKKATTTIAQGTNQHRMYCTAAARFLESLGITNYPLFSVVTDGPQAVVASAWIKQGRVYIFERHTQSFDISTAIGAWHYATVLCRIAVWQSRELYAKFAEVKDELIQRLKGSDKALRWKIKHQLETLDASNVAKRPPRAKKNQTNDEK